MHTATSRTDTGISLTTFRKEVLARFPGVNFTFKADFMGFTALSEDVSVEYNATTPPGSRWEVWLGKLSPATSHSLRDAVESARRAVTETIKSALRAGLEIS